MKDMVSDLIRSLRGREVKLVAGMRVVGLLRRVLPELEAAGNGAGGGQEGLFGALFLVCRLSTLVNMLSALEPLKDLADQETGARNKERQEKESKGAETNGYSRQGGSSSWATGQQTEQYLKRYIEIFREQSFAIVSMYKSIFPTSIAASAAPTTPTLPSHPKSSQHPASQSSPADKHNQDNNILFDPPSALSTFPLHLVSLLTDTLQEYLPNIRDRSSRESLLTQVLYCAGSLGRLGGDFSLVIAQLDMDSQDQDEEYTGEQEPGNQKEVGEDDDHESVEDNLEQQAEETSAADAQRKHRGTDEARREEWVEVMKKHRELAGRLELLASGVGLGANRTMSSSARGTTEPKSKA